MAQVIFSYDTEDYTSSYSYHAARMIAEILADEEVIGAFNVVGEIARQMMYEKHEEYSLKPLFNHEINYHSLKHSWHPTIVEYCDTEDWLTGYKIFIEEEKLGIKLVKDAFGLDKIWAAVPPGNSITMQAAYGYGQLGIPIYSGSIFKKTKGRGIWYCGTLNLENNLYIEDILFNDRLDEIYHHLDELAGWDRLIICGHPNMAVYRQHWDSLNMKGGNFSKWGDWKEADRRDQEEIDLYCQGLRKLIRMFKEHGGFEFVTYGDVYNSVLKDTNNISLHDSSDFIAKAVDNFFHFEFNDHSYSLAQAFAAAVNFVRKDKSNYAPNEMLGPIDDPISISNSIYLDKSDLENAAKRIDLSKPIPSFIELNSIKIGPGDFLRAASQLMSGALKIYLTPNVNVPNISGFFDMDKFILKNTWMHSELFEDKWVTKRLYNQAWTIRMENKYEQ